MARGIKSLICISLLAFSACGVKGPPVPYVDVVAKEKAAEEKKFEDEKEARETKAKEEEAAAEETAASLKKNKPKVKKK